MAGKKYHGEGKIGENHNIWGKKRSFYPMKIQHFYIRWN
jgi:hypothetical protein